MMRRLGLMQNPQKYEEEEEDKTLSVRSKKENTRRKDGGGGGEEELATKVLDFGPTLLARFANHFDTFLE